MRRDALLPLREGALSEAVADVQRRLTALGLGPIADAPGSFGQATRAALEAFQYRRGLRVDGVCGPETWATLVEAGFKLGDRFLYRRTPALRGDDVANLQQYLSALGFDTGRVDGIFGDHTAEAIREFQLNAGLPVDGICGAETLVALRRFQAPHHPHNLVSTVRAREALRRVHPGLAGSHVAVGQPGGAGTALAALRRRLLGAGARVTSLHHPSGSVQAQQANAAQVDVYVGLRIDVVSPGCWTAYYAGYRDESPGGHHLARLVQNRLPQCLGVPDAGVRGMSLPVLRETRMPAVIIEVGPPAVVVEQGPAMAEALTGSLTAWSDSPGAPEATG
jgi:N-acetylmuramoyl-L-alanine amidase